MYDAIVIGARCAGSPTAMLLAREGYRVLLVDKSTFPSDIMSTHYIHIPGVERLRRWGLLDRLRATNCPPLGNARLHLGEIEFVPPAPAGATPGPDFVPEAFCPRRTVLDKLLVDAAVEAGAELREDFSVRDLVFADGAVAGTTGTAKSGPAVTDRAHIVIGADGLHSTVARHVRPAEYDTKPSLTYGYYAYWSGVGLEEAELYFLDGAGVLAFPTNDSLTCVAVGGPHDGFQEFRKDIEGNYTKIIEMAPKLAQRMRGATRETRFVGTADQPNYFRRPHGPGWALVGDAGYHRDFVTGLGITDAFRDAELLAEAVDAGFSGRRPLEDALAAYEQRRNQIAKPSYDVTISMARGEGDLNTFIQLGLAIQGNLPAQVGGPA